MTVNQTTNVVEVNIDGELFKLRLSADQQAKQVLNTAVKVEQAISVLRKNLPNEEYHRLLLLASLQLAAEVPAGNQTAENGDTRDKYFHTSKDEMEKWIKTIEEKIENILRSILNNKSEASSKRFKKK